MLAGLSTVVLVRRVVRDLVLFDQAFLVELTVYVMVFNIYSSIALYGFTTLLCVVLYCCCCVN